MAKHRFRPKANGDRECTVCEKTIRWDVNRWATIKGTFSSQCGPPPPGEFLDKDDVLVGKALQPNGTGTCGQTALANVAGISYAEGCKAFGHKDRAGTFDWEIVQAFKKLGWHCTGSHRSERPQFGVAKVLQHPKKRSYHWMAVVDGQIVNGYKWNKVGARIMWYLHCEKEG